MIHFRPGEHQRPRLGVVVAKRLARRANVRNLLKRIVREQFRCQRTALPLLDLVVRLHDKVDEASRAMLHADVSSLLGRLKKT